MNKQDWSHSELLMMIPIMLSLIVGMTALNAWILQKIWNFLIESWLDGPHLTYSTSFALVMGVSFVGVMLRGKTDER